MQIHRCGAQNSRARQARSGGTLTAMMLLSVECRSCCIPLDAGSHSSHKERRYKLRNVRGGVHNQKQARGVNVNDTKEDNACAKYTTNKAQQSTRVCDHAQKKEERKRREKQRNWN